MRDFSDENYLRKSERFSKGEKELRNSSWNTTKKATHFSS